MDKSLYLVVSNLSGGGAERVVSYLSKGLSPIFDTKIVLHTGKKITYKHGGQIIDLNTPPPKLYLIKLFYVVIRALKLYSLKREDRPVASISFMESSNFINVLSGNTGKVIISVRNYKSIQLNKSIDVIHSFLIKLLYKKCTMVVTPSKGIKKDLTENYGISAVKIKVIYNPCDYEMISQESKESIGEEYSKLFEQPVLITAGKLMLQKGHSHLIHSFKELKKTIPEMRLVIIGEGELEEQLKTLVNKLSLEDSIFFIGFQKNPFKYITRSSIFVLPSLFEGFPNVLVEAMACGIPVVATDCRSGPREILAPETDFNYQTDKVEFAKYGIITPVFENVRSADEKLMPEEKMLAEAIVELYSDQAKYNYYKNKGLERVADFNLQTITDQWIELIEN